MKVFLSWSGARSKAIAEELRMWLPKILKIEPWVSPVDMTAGTIWHRELNESLAEARFAVMCLTEENLSSPWLMFEAGTLSKGLTGTTETRIVPYVLDVEIPERNPLAHYHIASADHDGTRRLMFSLNDALGQQSPALKLTASDLNRKFSRNWAQLEETLKRVRQIPPTSDKRGYRTEWMGTGNAVVDAVLSRTATANVIRNTFILFGTPLHSAYPEAELEKIKNHIARFLEQGKHWHDIVSQEFLTWPQRLYFSFLKKNGDQTRYHVHRLKSSYPVINIILLEKHGVNSQDEVIFGWEHFLDHPNEGVFWSNDPEIVRTFRHYWEVLRKDSSEILAYGHRYATPVDVAGLWLRIVEFAQTAEPGGQKYYDVALVELETSEYGRTVTMVGHRFEGTDAVEFRAVSTNLLVADRNELWFHTSRMDNHELYSAGRYIFDDPNASGRFWRFWGDFTDMVPAEDGTHAVRRVVKEGRRIVETTNGTQLDGKDQIEAAPVALPTQPDERRRLAETCLKLYLNSQLSSS